jgi:hypothetical protein
MKTFSVIPVVSFAMFDKNIILKGFLMPDYKD